MAICIDKRTIEDLLRNYEHVLQYLIEHPDAKVESIPLMPSDAKKALLAWGNDTAVPMDADSLLLNALDDSSQTRQTRSLCVLVKMRWTMQR